MTVRVRPADCFVIGDDIETPALLKIDYRTTSWMYFADVSPSSTSSIGCTASARSWSCTRGRSWPEP